MNETIKRLTNAYATMFDDTVDVFVDNHDVELEGAAHYLARYGYLVTLIFKRRLDLAFDRSGDKGSAQFRNLDHIYNLICRRALGRRYAQYRENQPLVIAGLDVNGTRRSKHVSQVENIHIHAIWVTPSTFHGKFVSALFDLKHLKNLEKFDIQRIDVKRLSSMTVRNDGVTSVSSYVAKFLGQNAVWMQLTGDDFRIYPKPALAKPESSVSASQSAGWSESGGDQIGSHGGRSTEPCGISRAARLGSTSDHRPSRTRTITVERKPLRPKRKSDREEMELKDREAMNARFASLFVDEEEVRPATVGKPTPYIYEPGPAEMSERVKQWLDQARRAATEKRFSEFFVDEMSEESSPDMRSELARQPSAPQPQYRSAPRPEYRSAPSPQYPTQDPPRQRSAPAPEYPTTRPSHRRSMTGIRD